MTRQLTLELHLGPSYRELLELAERTAQMRSFDWKYVRGDAQELLENPVVTRDFGASEQVESLQRSGAATLATPGPVAKHSEVPHMTHDTGSR